VTFHRGARTALAAGAVLLSTACSTAPGTTSPVAPVLSPTPGGSSGGTSSASCVGPYLNDQPPSGPFRAPAPIVSPGDTLTLHGHWYTTTCNDTGGDDPLKPMRPVHLTLTWPGGAVERLGALSPAGVDMGFSATVRVPAGTPAGIARVHDDRPGAPTYRFHIGR
jgi:hypothetical protein